MITFSRLLLPAILWVLLCFQSSIGFASEEGPGTLKQKIRYLINYVSHSQVKFIRNGNEYTSVEAAEHIEKKYLHYKEEIKTAEDFIRLAATKSLLSGKSYLVVTLQGEQIQTNAWLLGVLTDYQKDLKRSAYRHD
jgi:hypothetical protein